MNYQMLKTILDSLVSNFKCPTCNSSVTEKEAKTGLSACVLDYLLDNQELIPSEWKGKSILFTATIFKDSSGSPLYKTLIYQDNKWTWGKNYPEYILEKTYKVSM